MSDVLVGVARAAVDRGLAFEGLHQFEEWAARPVASRRAETRARVRRQRALTDQLRAETERYDGRL